MKLYPLSRWKISIFLKITGILVPKWSEVISVTIIFNEKIEITVRSGYSPSQKTHLEVMASINIILLFCRYKHLHHCFYVGWSSFAQLEKVPLFMLKTSLCSCWESPFVQAEKVPSFKHSVFTHIKSVVETELRGNWAPLKFLQLWRSWNFT